MAKTEFMLTSYCCSLLLLGREELVGKKEGGEQGREQISGLDRQTHNAIGAQRRGRAMRSRRACVGSSGLSHAEIKAAAPFSDNRYVPFSASTRRAASTACRSMNAEAGTPSSAAARWISAFTSGLACRTTCEVVLEFTERRSEQLLVTEEETAGSSTYAATSTETCPASRFAAFGRMTISTSLSSRVMKCSSRSEEKRLSL